VYIFSRDALERSPDPWDFRTGTNETAGDYLPETKSAPAAWLLEQMDDTRLALLRSHFFPNGPSQNRTSHSGPRLSYRGMGLTKSEFASAVCGIIGTDDFIALVNI